MKGDVMKNIKFFVYYIFEKTTVWSLIILLGIVLFFVRLLGNHESINACVFSKKSNKQTIVNHVDFTEFNDVKSKKNVNNKTNKNSMKLEIANYPNLPEDVSVSFNRISDWNEKELEIIADGADIKKIKIYSAKFTYKKKSIETGQEIRAAFPREGGSFGLVFDESQKPVWFGWLNVIPPEKFINCKDEFFLFQPDYDIVCLAPSIIDKFNTDGIRDQSSDSLDKLVYNNFQYKCHLQNKLMVCKYHDYFDNPNFTMAQHSLETKNPRIENGLLCLDVERRSELADPSDEFVQNGSLWIDLKKGTVEKVEDRTNYPLKYRNARIAESENK
jgi:hypothetical protein